MSTWKKHHGTTMTKQGEAWIGLLDQAQNLEPRIYEGELRKYRLEGRE